MLWDRGRTLAYAGDDDLVLDESDDAAAIPKSIVIDASFDWEGDQLLRRPWDATVIYELHVQGLHAADARRARGPARHLCGAGLRCRDRRISSTWA